MAWQTIVIVACQIVIAGSIGMAFYSVWHAPYQPNSAVSGKNSNPQTSTQASRSLPIM